MSTPLNIRIAKTLTNQKYFTGNLSEQDQNTMTVFNKNSNG